MAAIYCCKKQRSLKLVSSDAGQREEKKKKRASGLHYGSGTSSEKIKGYTKSCFVLDSSTLPVLFKPFPTQLI